MLPGGGLQRGAVIAVDTGDGTPAAGVAGAGPARWLSPCSPPPRPPGPGVRRWEQADPGILAIAELGVDLDHLALVPWPGAAWPEVTAILLDDMDVVLVCPPGRVRPGVARRLAARARQRRAVLVVQAGPGTWPEGPDVQLTVEGGAWEGVDRGHGHLRGRRVEVVTSGRRSAVRGVRTGLWLPAASGAVAAV